MTFAARDFSSRRGESDEHIPQWICEERATKSGRKRPAALRVARIWPVASLLVGYSHMAGMRPPHASPQAKLGATNVIVFMPQTTKYSRMNLGMSNPIAGANAEERREPFFKRAIP